MDPRLRATLTSPRVGCTQEQIAALVAADVTDAETLGAIADADFKELGISIGLRARMRGALQSTGGQSNCSAGGAFHFPQQAI